MHILQLIRWKNLCLLALTQLLIKYALLEPFNAQTALDGLGISLLILATVCIAAAGNVINDIYDTETDAINKPEKCIINKTITEQNAYTLFIILNIIGVVSGFYLAHRVGKSTFASIFVLISALLYMYSTYLKRIALIGNLVISVLIAVSILIVALFELSPTLQANNAHLHGVFFKIIRQYALFAFALNLLRELVKDIEDIEGDSIAGIKTLPAHVGIPVTKSICITLHCCITLVLICYCIEHLYNQTAVLVYALVFIIAPLLYTAIKLFDAKSKTHFKHISNVYKITMLMGILSLLRFVIHL